MTKKKHLFYFSVVALTLIATVGTTYLLGFAFDWRNASLLPFVLLAPLYVALVWMKDALITRSKAVFGGAERVAALRNHSSARGQIMRGVSMTLAIFGVAIALVGPRYGTRTELLRKRGIDLVIALDMSKSMLAKDVAPSRFERAKLEISDFLSSLGGDRVGVVAFAGDTISYPMTDDYAATQLFLRDLHPYDMPVGGTAIGKALNASWQLLQRTKEGSVGAGKEATQVVVLFTDGEDHEGDPVAVAEELKDAGIRVFTVGIGSKSGEPIPTYSSDRTWTGYLRDDDQKLVTTSLTAANEKTLKKIASLTNGKYFAAGKGQVGVKAIAKRISKMQQKEREARRIVVHEDRYELALIPALFFFLLAMLIPSRLRISNTKEREVLRA